MVDHRTETLKLQTTTMSVKFQLQRRRWFGWAEGPPDGTGWPASPIFVTAITPLKTGAGLLKLDFLQPMRPGGGARRSLVLKVIQHSPRHLAASFDEEGVERTALISDADYSWLEAFCPLLVARRPPRHPTWIIDGVLSAGLAAQEYLADEFRSTDEEILTGSRPTSFAVKLRRMPKQSSIFHLNRTYEPLDAWLIARGFIPRQMEDKWFVYLDRGKLHFHRSWTGVLVYEVEAAWRGDRLYLGQVRVNRNPSQYGETDDEYDKRLLQYLVDAVLLGLPSAFPIKEGGDEDVAALQAWSIAGSASINT